MKSGPAWAGTALLWGSASALFLLLLTSVFRAQDVPTPLAAALFAIASGAAYSPRATLLVLASLIPIAAWTGRHWNGNVAWPETLAVAYLAGYAARQIFESRDKTSDRLVLAIYCMVAVVAASLAVQLLVLEGTIGGQALRERLWELISVEYFTVRGGFEGVDAAMRLIEGLLLMHAGLTAARSLPSFGPWMIRAVVLGAVAASGLNLWRVWLGALRLDTPVVAFLQYLATLRFNTHYADVNAAGSYYVQALLPALSLARDGSRALWIPASVVIAISLVLTGSRAAMLAGLVAGLIAWWLERRSGTGRRERKDAWRWSLVSVALVIALAAGGAIYLLLIRNVTPAGSAVAIRGEFAQTALRMFAAHPIFGAGIGQYYALSSEFSTPELRAVYPRENAHNNFLQILAEAGVVGFAVFVWLLTVAATRLWTPVAGRAPNAPTALVVAGPLAFLLTWLAGHPLLIDEPALTFWLLLGSLAGSGTTEIQAAESGNETASRTSGSLSRWAVPSLAITLAISVPIRADYAMATVNLEHQGIGLSEWHTGSNDIRYRIAAANSTVFIPSEAIVVTLPLRSMVPETELEVEIQLEDRIADIVRVPSNEWRTLSIQMPERADGRRFRALGLRVRDASRRDVPMLMVGKVQPR
jgi:O-antigen ligase